MREIAGIAKQILQRMHQFRATLHKRHGKRGPFIEGDAETRAAKVETLLQNFLDNVRQGDRRLQVERFSRLIIVKFPKNNAAPLDFSAKQHHILVKRVVLREVVGQFMANNRDRVERRAKAVRGSGRQRAERHRLLFLGENKARLRQRLVEAACARGDPPCVDADENSRENERHPEPHQIQIRLGCAKRVKRERIIEQSQKTDAAGNECDQHQGFAAAKHRRRNDDRRQQQYGEGVQQPASEIKKCRQLKNIENECKQALVACPADNHRATGLPYIHCHRETDHEQRRCDRDFNLKDKECEQQREQLAGKRKPSDVENYPSIGRVWRRSAPFARLQQPAHARNHRPNAAAGLQLLWHLSGFRHQDWRLSAHSSG